MPVSSDVFLSYPHKEQASARGLAAALRAEGLTVWMDETNVGAFEHIHDHVAHGIAGSRAVIAWYSHHYAASRPCQWELSAAWLCEGGERILVINPEADDRHIRPRSLVNRAYLDADDLPAIARQVKSHLTRFASSIGDAVSFSQPLHYGRQLTGSNHFVGRNDHFWSTHDALSESGATMLTGATRSVVQLRGFGGGGKSVLAEEYALRFGAAYPGGVFWLKAYGNEVSDTPMRPEDREGERLRQLSEFASQLHLPTEGMRPPEIHAALAKFFGSSDRRSLWIVDDVPSGLRAGDLSTKWLSPHASVPTLITTRDRSHTSLGTLIDVDVLSEEESFALLETHRRVEDSERRAARELLDALGHHALAVEVTGSFLADQRSVSFEDFLGELRDPHEDVLVLAGELADTLPLDHSPCIVATLQLSIDKLKEPARDLLCLASCLAAAPIPKELIEAVLARLYATGSPASARMRATKQTNDLSLSRTESTPADALSVHKLVARTALRHLGAAERLEKIRAAAVASLTDTLRGMFSLGSILRQSLVITHARALSASPATAGEAALLVHVANTDLQRGDLETAERLARHALDYCRAELGEDALETCYARSGVAMVLLARGESAGAREILEAVAPVFERALPAGDIFRVGAQLALAVTLAAQGDFTSALERGEAAVSASADSNGPDHPATLNAKATLGLILRARGDLQGAARLQQEVVEARGRMVDELDVDSLTDEFLMAQTTLVSGEIESSAHVIEMAAEVFEQELGEDNVLTLNAKLMRLLLLMAQGDAPEARQLAGELIPRFEQIFGARNPATLIARWAEAEVLAAADDIDDVRAGLSRLEGVVPEMEAVLGADNAEVMLAKVGLAGARRSGGDPDGARRILDTLLPAAEARLGPAHTVTLNGKQCLALCLYEQGHRLFEQGDQGRACEVWAEGAAVREGLLGGDHPEVLTSKLLIAQTLAQMGQYRRSDELLREAIPLAEARLGPEHETTLMFKTCLAFCRLGMQAGDV